MYFRGEVEAELRESGHTASSIFQSDDDFEEVMHDITEKAIVYSHQQSKVCSDRGIPRTLLIY